MSQPPPLTEIGKKSSFILHYDFHLTLDKLSDVQAGKVIKAIFEWHLTGELPEIDFTTELVITPLIAQFNRDVATYNKRCKSNRENGKRGGRPLNPIKPKKPSGLIGNTIKADKRIDSNQNIGYIFF